MIVRQYRKATAVLSLVLMVALAGCGSYLENLAKTGDQLAIAGDLFADTGKMYDSLYQSGAIGEDVYGPWREFATNFKKAYPAAVATWKSLKAHPDADSGDLNEVLDLISDLSSRLFEFYRYAFAKARGAE